MVRGECSSAIDLRIRLSVESAGLGHHLGDPFRPTLIPQKKADSRLAIAYLDERVAGNADPHRFGKGLKADLAGLRHYRVGDSAILYGLIQYRKPVDLREESSPAFPTVEKPAISPMAGR
jgi:hypothetical protein